MSPEEIKNLTDDQVDKLNTELHNRIVAIRSLCDPDSINADWKSLMDDEANRNYFLRMMTSVACVAHQAIQSGQFPNGEPMLAYMGCKAVMKFVLGCSIGEDARKGKMKL